MSKYTTEVRFICETAAGKLESEGYLSIDSILTTAAPKIFNFDYPIFDEKYRLVLEKKILKHYYTREIAHETVGLWKLHLDAKMNEIMPYYNKLYESELLDFNPLYEVDLTTTRKIDMDGHTTGTTKVVGSSTKDITNTVSDETSSEVTTTKDEATEFSDTKTDKGRVTKDSTLTLDTVDTKDYKNTRNLTEDISGGGSNTANGKVKTAVSGSTNHSTTIKDDNTHTDRYSDTPQGSLTGALMNEYLTNVRIIDDKNKREDTGTESTASDTDVITDMIYTNDGTSKKTDSGNITDTGTLARTGTEQSIGADTHDITITDTGNNSTTGNERVIGLDKGKNTGSSNETGSDNRDTTENRNINNVTDYIETVKGIKGGKSYTQLITEFRAALLNIDLLIIEDLSDLFFKLWE